jgi:hypothetical protein
MLEIYHNLLRAARRRWGKKLMGEVSMEFRETFRAFKSSLESPWKLIFRIKVHKTSEINQNPHHDKSKLLTKLISPIVCNTLPSHSRHEIYVNLNKRRKTIFAQTPGPKILFSRQR